MPPTLLDVTGWSLAVGQLMRRLVQQPAEDRCRTTTEDLLIDEEDGSPISED